MPQPDEVKKDPETPPVEQAPPPIEAPTVDELNATLQAERQRAMSLEADRARLEQALWNRRDVQPAPETTGNDPYAQFADNVITGDPKENQRVLRTAVRSDVARGVNQVRSEVSQVLNQQRVEFEAQRALDRVMARIPEVSDPANQSKFAGLITKAQVDAQAQGLQLSMDQIADRAAREYVQVYGGGKPRTNMPHVEGATPPGYTPQYTDPNQPLTKNGLEEAYGMEAGTIEPIDASAMKKITRESVREKNKYARSKGVGSSLIINTVTEAT